MDIFNGNILNLTQHPATQDQLDQRVADQECVELAELLRLLTFDTLPSASDIADRAEALAELAVLCARQTPGGASAAMIGGAPYLMAPLERALIARGISPVYAFSRRESVEAVQADGSIRKTAIFKHVGFIRADGLLDGELPGA